MKRLLTFTLAVVVTLPLLAAPKASRARFKSGSEAKVRKLPSDPGRLARILTQYQMARNNVGVSAIADARSARLLLFPAAGNARGAGGEFFRSDVTLISYNPDNHQHLAAIWIQNGVTTDDPPAVEITLDPNIYYTFADMVGTTLSQQNQLGSILIVPVDHEGEIDFAGTAIDGYSRIWTNQPNATGTVAQPFQAVDPYSLIAFHTASIMGLRHDPQYRSNYGISNIDDVPHTFEVKFIGDNLSSETTVTVPAMGMIHVPVPAGNYGPLVIEVSVDEETAPWVAYGTSNDNITGDGWVSIGSGILTQEDLDDVDGGL
jgi:hypothetical protein